MWWYTSPIDEYTRECLALEVGQSMRAVDVIDMLSQVMLIRSDSEGDQCVSPNTEFSVYDIVWHSWAAEVGPLYIKPGSPWENRLWKSRIRLS